MDAEPGAPVHITQVPEANQLDRVALDARTLFEERIVGVSESGNDVPFRYRLLRPKTLLKGQRYPLVLFLHGAGERGSDNLKQLKYLPTWMAEPHSQQKHPCFVLAPQCRIDERWADVSWNDKKSTPQPAQLTTDLSAALAAMNDVIDHENVDPDRIYLTGLSMGGYGTWDLAARLPDRFAAIIPICGGGDERTGLKLAALPMWCFHGDADTSVPVERSRTMIEAVKAAGGSPRYSEFSGIGHDAWTPAYGDPAVLDWLFNQRRNQSK
jgi:predicted peptidase